jgi:hypothetical protein
MQPILSQVEPMRIFADAKAIVLTSFAQNLQRKELHVTVEILF